MSLTKRLKSPRTGRVLWAELPRIPMLIVERLGIRHSTEPWMAHGAVKELDRLLRGEDILLELGSGRSTRWYADRVAEVTSIEPDEEWARSTIEGCADVGNVSVVSEPIEQFLQMPDLSRKEYSVAIVDHTEIGGWNRRKSVELLLALNLRLLVVDDSQREAYGDLNFEPNWETTRFTSLKSFPFAPVETSLLENIRLDR